MLNIKNTKITSVISALAVLAMLSPTVFANKTTADTAANNYTLKLFFNNEKIELENETFAENGELLSGNSDEILAVANTWAEALKTRDSLPRYEIMTTTMQEQFVERQKQNAGEFLNYVIGYSSPKTLSYEISLNGNTVLITYLQEDNTGEQYKLKKKITLEKFDDKILVSAAEDIETKQ